MDSQPEATWQAAAASDPGTHLQSSQVTESSCTQLVPAAHPAQDPLHHAPCILDALRLRHIVRSNIQQGAVRQTEVQHSAGMASLPRGQHAAIDETDEGLALVIRDLTSAALLQSWPLPERVRHVYSHWSWDGRMLAMPCNIGAYHGAVLLADPADGRCTLLEGVILLSSWSSTGLLLVQAAYRLSDEFVGSDDSDGVPIVGRVRAVDAAGALVCEADLQCYQFSRRNVQWSPDGRVAFLHYTGRSFWLWAVAAGAMSEHDVTQELPDFCIETVAWSPDSRRLIFRGYRSEWVMVWSHQGQQLQTIGSPSQASDTQCAPAWGSLDRVVFWDRAGPLFEGQERSIRVCRVSSSGCLECLGRVCWKYAHTPLAARALSPDGSMVAVNIVSDEADQAGVLVIGFDARLQHLFLLPFAATTLQWAADGASLLASTSDGTCHALLDFA